jgi:hypothetical protein
MTKLKVEKIEHEIPLNLPCDKLTSTGSVQAGWAFKKENYFL